MPLNEDDLRKVFEAWFRPSRPLLRDDEGNYVYMAAHSAWQTFKAAYSPEVLQALGVVICYAKPVAEVVDSKLADFMPSHQKVEWHRTEFAVGTKFHAIKEQS